jgi:hypothetical protein
LDIFVEMKVHSLRALRDSVLDELVIQRDGSYGMAELRRFMERLADPRSTPESAVLEYWQERLQSIPSAEQNPNVTPIEMGDALRQWLEVLLEDYLDVYSEGSSGSEAGECTPQHQVPAFGFNTADFGTGLAGTAEFGSQLGSSASAADRFPVSIDISGGGTFGSAHMQQISRSPGLDSSAVPSWLKDSEQGELFQVRKFREHLTRQISLHSDGSEPLTVSLLYSAVRDVVEAEQEASVPLHGGGGSSSTPRRRAARSVIYAAVRRLAGVKNRWLRQVFRDLESQTLLVYRPLATERHPEGSDIIAELVVSQARAAEVLERRASCFPVAFRVAWVVDIARRRHLGNAFARLQLLGDSGFSTGSAPASRAAGSGAQSPGFSSKAASPGVQSPGFDYHSEAREAASSYPPPPTGTTAHRGKVSAAWNPTTRSTETRKATGVTGGRRTPPTLELG